MQGRVFGDYVREDCIQSGDLFMPLPKIGPLLCLRLQSRRGSLLEDVRVPVRLYRPEREETLGEQIVERVDNLSMVKYPSVHEHISRLRVRSDRRFELSGRGRRRGRTGRRGCVTWGVEHGSNVCGSRREDNRRVKAW